MNDINNPPLISIITATYNADKCLNLLIESIAQQKTEDLEFVIIDGGSNDRTIKIIESYSKYIDYWISETDEGIYDAWNKGIKAAKGKWIMFLGSDDIILPDTIYNYLQLLKKNDYNKIDYISGNVNYVNEENKILKVLGSEYSWNNMKKYMSVAHVGSLHNKFLFNEVGLFDLKYKICADYELLVRKKEKLTTIYINKVIAQMKSGGLSFSLNAIKETYKIRKAHHTVSLISNYLYCFRDIIGYSFFRLKKGLLINK